MASHIHVGGPLVVYTWVCLVALHFAIIIVWDINIAMQHFLLVIGIYVCVELLGYTDYLLLLGVDMFNTNFPLYDSSVLINLFHLEV